MWDLVVYLLVVAVAMAVFVMYRDKAFIGTFSKASGAALLLCLFGTSALPLSYVYSFAFQNHANAQACCCCYLLCTTRPLSARTD